MLKFLRRKLDDVLADTVRASGGGSGGTPAQNKQQDLVLSTVVRLLGREGE